jgi:hypothetical protein
MLDVLYTILQVVNFPDNLIQKKEAMELWNTGMLDTAILFRVLFFKFKCFLPFSISELLLK